MGRLTINPDGTIKGSKGRKYDYEIIFNWMNDAFNWLGDWWYQIKQSMTIWEYINAYPWLFYDRVLNRFGIDLKDDSTLTLALWFEKTGLLILRGDLPLHAGYKVEKFIEFVREFFRSGGDYMT